jgi:hypothetical protein
VVASWGSLLRCRLCLPGIVHVVVAGVLLGAGRTVVLLIKTSLVFYRLNKKRTQKWDREVTSPGPVGGPPRPRSRRCCHLGPVLVVAVVPVVAVPREPLMSSWFPFLFCTCSLFVHNR